MKCSRRIAPGHSTVCKGGGKEIRRLAEAETSEILERAFEAYREPIKNVLEFRYLGRVLTAGDDAWLVVAGNLGKAQKS